MLIGGGEGWGSDGAGSALVLRDENMSIAERNEEINKRRMERNRGGGGQARITNMDAYKSFLAKAEENARKQKEIETAEELERMKREGANYKPKAQREAEARARRERYKTGGGDEARGVSCWCNPLKDYYKILGVDKTAAAHEIKKSYKRLALQYHPDKQKGATEEQLEALKEKFKDVMEAYDVLSDEERRISWERLREQMKTGGASGGQDAKRTMSPEEAAAYMAGLRELARIKRQGYKRTTKHSPKEHPVYISMRKMYSGHNKTVSVWRKECDASGGVVERQKVFHLMIRRGSYDGMRIVFEDEGDETTEYLPGDVIIVLHQKPQKEFKRSGAKDLVTVGPPVERGDIWFLHEVKSLAGTRIVMFGSALFRSLESQGAGGFLEERHELEGMQDPEDPWDNPPGDLIIKLFQPGVKIEDRVFHSCVAPGPVFLLGSSDHAGAGAVAGAAMGIRLNERMEASQMRAEEGHAKREARRMREEKERQQQQQQGEKHQKEGKENKGAMQRDDSARDLMDIKEEFQWQWPAETGAVCLCLSPSGEPSPAATGAMQAASMKVGGLKWRNVSLIGGSDLLGTSFQSANPSCSSVLLDEDWVALDEAEVIIVDFTSPDGLTDQGQSFKEAAIHALGSRLRPAGLLHQLYMKWMFGTQILAVQDAVGLLGQQYDDDVAAQQPDQLVPSPAGADGCQVAPSLLPHVVRCGGGAAGWSELHNAVANWPAAAGNKNDAVKGVGIMLGAFMIVDASIWWEPEDSVHMVVAPTQSILAETAAGCANFGVPLRFDDYWDEEDDLVMAADEGFSERCNKALISTSRES